MGKHFVDAREDEILSNERLQPYLLDRLTRDPYEPDQQTMLPPHEFKERLRRDLTWLLNAHCHPDHQLLENEFPLVASSGMNFGMPAFKDVAIAAIGTNEIVDRVREAIVRFEPRIIPRTLSIQFPRDSLAARKAIGACVIELVIEGEAIGIPERLAFRTSVNVATGMCDLEEQERS